MDRMKQLIDKRRLKELVPCPPQHIHRLEPAGTFPKRVRLGPNRVAWLLSEVEEWIEARAAGRDASEEHGGSF